MVVRRDSLRAPSLCFACFNTIQKKPGSRHCRTWPCSSTTPERRRSRKHSARHFRIRNCRKPRQYNCTALMIQYSRIYKEHNIYIKKKQKQTKQQKATHIPTGTHTLTHAHTNTHTRVRVSDQCKKDINLKRKGQKKHYMLKGVMFIYIRLKRVDKDYSESKQIQDKR